MRHCSKHLDAAKISFDDIKEEKEFDDYWWKSMQVVMTIRAKKTIMTCIFSTIWKDCSCAYDEEGDIYVDDDADDGDEASDAESEEL